MIEKIAKEKVSRSKRHTEVCELVQQWLRHGCSQLVQVSSGPQDHPPS